MAILTLMSDLVKANFYIHTLEIYTGNQRSMLKNSQLPQAETPAQPMGKIRKSLKKVRNFRSSEGKGMLKI